MSVIFCSLLERSCSSKSSVARKEGDVTCWCPTLLFLFFTHAYCRHRSGIVPSEWGFLRVIRLTAGVGGSILFPFWFWDVPVWVGAAPLAPWATFLFKAACGTREQCLCALGVSWGPCLTPLPWLSPTGTVLPRVCMSPPETFCAWLGWEGSQGHGLSLSMKLSRDSSKVMQWDKQ